MALFFDRAKNFYLKSERYLSATALLFGFVVDNLTFKRVDLPLTNFILFSYIVIAGGGIALLQAYKSGRIHSSWFENIAHFFPLLIQFAFGGLFSGYFVFYSRSGSLTGSLFFIALLFALLVGNEFFRIRYQKLVFQVSIFYAALFSFAIFFIPVLMGMMGASVFLISGLVSLLLIALMVYGLSRIAPAPIAKERKALAKSIGGIFLFMNMLYFSNTIPPVPLSLKDIGVYHRVERTDGGGYVVYGEEPPPKLFELRGRTFHHVPGERVYAYSAIFAPTKLDTPVIHRWQYFDEVKKVWIFSSDISFPVTGGRDGGYRGFSFKENVFPGNWRVDVVTPRGQIIGRINFTVVDAEHNPILFAEEK